MDETLTFGKCQNIGKMKSNHVFTAFNIEILTVGNPILYGGNTPVCMVIHYFVEVL